MPEVTIVIPTFNRPQRLLSTLRSLLAQTETSFDVIVVDDCSDVPIDAQIGPDLRDSLRLRLLRTERNSGPAAARNLGLRAASTEFIAFLDDDVDAGEDWLASHLEAARGGPHVVSIGPLFAPPGWSSTPWNNWEAATLARQYAAMTSGQYAATWRQFFTGSAMVRRADILAVGGFDERFTRAEDIELALRLFREGAQFVFASKAIGWHYANRNFASWRTIPRAYARFDVILDGLYPDLAWLEMIAREAGYRPRLTRAVRRLARFRPLRPLMTTAAVAVARSSYAIHLRRLSARTVGVLYDIEYHQALRAARADGARLEPAGPHARTINPASTAPQRRESTVAFGSDS